jgi:methylase of polypeptide subunit release factors
MDEWAPARSATAALALNAFLRENNYTFVTTTPATHQLVNKRPGNEQAQSLRDIFGWSRPFQADLLPAMLFDILTSAGVVVAGPVGWRCLLRASSLDEDIFLHSAFPTTSADAVFFGPDTYRFARAIKANLIEPRRIQRALDLGCGSGAGGVVVAKNSVCRELVLSDINDMALQLARLNAEAAGVVVTTVYSDLFDRMDGQFDLIVANPPYLNDPLERKYRHGSGPLGSGLSLRIAQEAQHWLAPGGTLLLYTGSPIMDGIDQFRTAIGEAFTGSDLLLSYEEVDPDVFGEELEKCFYSRVDRIAAVVFTARRPEVI